MFYMYRSHHLKHTSRALGINGGIVVRQFIIYLIHCSYACSWGLFQALGGDLYHRECHESEGMLFTFDPHVHIVRIWTGCSDCFLPNTFTCHDGVITSDSHQCARKSGGTIKNHSTPQLKKRGRSMVTRDLASWKHPRDEGENILWDSKCVDWHLVDIYYPKPMDLNIQKTSTMCTQT